MEIASYGWQNTGNFTNTSDGTARWQVDVANSFSTWASIVSAHGSEPLKEVDIILDGGYGAPRGQEVMVDNFTVNTKHMNSGDVQHQYGQ